MQKIIQNAHACYPLLTSQSSRQQSSEVSSHKLRLHPTHEKFASLTSASEWMVLGCSEEIWCAIDGEKCVLKRILVPAMRSRRSPGARVSTTRHSAHSLGNERLMQPKTEKHSKNTNECGSSKASNTDMTTCNMRHDGVLGFFRRCAERQISCPNLAGSAEHVSEEPENAGVLMRP